MLQLALDTHKILMLLLGRLVRVLPTQPHSYPISKIILTEPGHTKLFKIISQKYSRYAMQASRRYINTSKRIARQFQHFAFNHRSQCYSIAHHYLRAKPHVPTCTLEGERIARKCSLNFLGEQVGRNHQALKRLRNELRSQFS